MEGKNCTKCGFYKPLEEFNFTDKAHAIHHSNCRECTKQASKISYRKRRDFYIQENKRLKRRRKRKLVQFLRNYFLSHPCTDCGLTDPLVLQFDHVNGEKKMSIAAMMTSALNLQTILDEIEKCEVRCANCHLRKTAKERGYYSYILQLKRSP